VSLAFAEKRASLGFLEPRAPLDFQDSKVIEGCLVFPERKDCPGCLAKWVPPVYRDSRVMLDSRVSLGQLA